MSEDNIDPMLLRALRRAEAKVHLDGWDGSPALFAIRGPDDTGRFRCVRFEIPTEFWHRFGGRLNQGLLVVAEEFTRPGAGADGQTLAELAPPDLYGWAFAVEVHKAHVGHDEVAPTELSTHPTAQEARLLVSVDKTHTVVFLDRDRATNAVTTESGTLADQRATNAHLGFSSGMVEPLHRLCGLARQP